MKSLALWPRPLVLLGVPWALIQGCSVLFSDAMPMNIASLDGSVPVISEAGRTLESGAPDSGAEGGTSAMPPWFNTTEPAYVFVTSGKFRGDMNAAFTGDADLEGVLLADKRCNENLNAKPRFRGRRFKAYLYDSDDAPSLSVHPGGWRTTNPTLEYAEAPEQMLSKNPREGFAVFRFDEEGRNHGDEKFLANEAVTGLGPLIWTGLPTSSDTQLFCSEGGAANRSWTQITSTGTATRGDWGVTNGMSCADLSAHLLCVEVPPDLPPR